jgi:prepilin-type N-terminal cleavage/methylation domain-containing protein
MDHRSPRLSGRLRGSPAEQGFTLIETLIALTILLIVMGTVVSGVMQFTSTQALVWNRSDMHGAVRSATELLQQEVGQAGRVSLAPGITMSTPVTSAGSHPVTVTSTANMFDGERVVVDTGTNEETVTVTVNSPTEFTANFTKTHAASVPLAVRGGFGSGVVPMNLPNGTLFPNGSRGNVLKLYGDINGDGDLVYVEYACTIPVDGPGTLTRNMMPFNAASKPAVTPGQVLLTNVLANPGGTPCFTYEQKVVTGQTYVVNVAITLTTQSQNRDRITGQFQLETKALLNVAPRNVLQAWMLASMSAGSRIQPMPPSVATLLP